MARNSTIQASARLPVGVSPHSADAPANTMTPRMTIFLCPTVSARRPPKAKNAASVSRYALTAHCTPVLDSPSSFWISGTAIETMVWSMNVIATAKIIAARIRPLGRLPVPLLADIIPPCLERTFSLVRRRPRGNRKRAARSGPVPG